LQLLLQLFRHRTSCEEPRTTHSGMQPTWQAHGIKPHLANSFELSTNKRFVDKVQDGVGLSLHRLNKDGVLSVDENSPIQAPDHTQPGLPLKVGSVHPRRVNAKSALEYGGNPPQIRRISTDPSYPASPPWP